MPRDFFHGRHAGLLVPLFSLPSRESWGIGEIGDLPRLGAWMADAGFSFVQLLPLNEMAEGQNSPYSAMSAMAIDPIYISPGSVPDIAVLGGEGLLPAAERAMLESARASRSIDYTAVRTVKLFALRAGFDHFREYEWKPDTNRALRFKAFIEHARWWIDDYALYRALHARGEARAWQAWDAPLRDRDPAALAAARDELATEILFYSYLQWLAANQWRRPARPAISASSATFRSW
jgi:4-alpha-glucanotransferase